MFVEAILDPERKGSSFQGLAERVAFFVTGVGFVLMAYATVNLLLGTEANGTTGLDDVAHGLLTPRLGRWSVGLVGAIVMTAGLLQIGSASVPASGIFCGQCVHGWSGLPSPQAVSWVM